MLFKRTVDITFFWTDNSQGPTWDFVYSTKDSPQQKSL